MPLSITKRFTFDAAHCLERHDGKCSRYHGHTYILEVTVIGGADEVSFARWHDQGFFLDLGKLSSIVQGELQRRWDHYDLNESLEIYPTAELLAHELWRALTPKLLAEGCTLRRIRLHETPDSWVEYTGHDPLFDHRATYQEAAMEALRNSGQHGQEETMTNPAPEE